MGEHQKNSKNKIYSSFACRLGKIVKQYDELQLEESEKYETTLYICVLQNLLTQFHEVVETGKNSEAKKATLNKNAWDECLPFWGIENRHLDKVSQGKNLKVKEVLSEIRHILSHPLSESDGLVYESISPAGKIDKYEFVRKNQQKHVIFCIALPIDNLRNLVIELSNYLSKELNKNETDNGKR